MKKSSSRSRPAARNKPSDDWKGGSGGLLGALGSEVGFTPPAAQEARVNAIIAQLRASSNKVTKAITDASKQAQAATKPAAPTVKRRRKAK